MKGTAKASSMSLSHLYALRHLRLRAWKKERALLDQLSAAERLYPCSAAPSVGQRRLDVRV
jgi:hypothetical protein